MAACSTLSDRGRKNASAGGDILEAIQQESKYDADQNSTGIISLDSADNVSIRSHCFLYNEVEKSLISKHKYITIY